MRNPQELAQQYQMSPHPEGGWYKETYRSAWTVPHQALPEGFADQDHRHGLTSIYFLLPQGQYSGLHKIASDELWYWHEGGVLEVWMVDEKHGLQIALLGPGHQYSLVVPAGTWFGSRPAPQSEFALVSCAVAPGFDFRDFIMADLQTMEKAFPQWVQQLVPMIRQ